MAHVAWQVLQTGAHVAVYSFGWRTMAHVAVYSSLSSCGQPFCDVACAVDRGTCCLVQLTQLWPTDFTMQLHVCRPAMGLGDFCIAGMAPLCTSMFAVLLWALERFCTCCQPRGVCKTTKLASDTSINLVDCNPSPTHLGTLV